MIEILVPWNGVPMIYKHVAVLGAYPGEVPLGPTGDTRAFDLRTGKKLWQFQNVPLPGQVGHETWLDYGWRDRSGTNVWAFYMTLDAERGILYMPVSAPAANYWGGDRPGANLFANSIVAVDAETGKYRWHFQTVHHDIWDFDMPSPPVLVDITQNGRRVPALASIGKIGLHVHSQPRHRQTDLRRRGAARCRKARCPDEWYSPTQPFPVKPARSFGRVEFDKERDMVRPEDTSAQHAAECQALWDKSGGFHNAGPFTPFVFHEDGAPPRSSVQFPGALRRRELGRPGRRSAFGPRLHQRARQLARRLDRAEEAGAELRPQHGRIDAAVRSRQRQRRRPLLQLHRALQRRDRPHRRRHCRAGVRHGRIWSRSTRTPARSCGKSRSA